jgi:hypothetical protein
VPFEKDELTTQLLRNNEPLPIPPQNLRIKTWFLQKENGDISAVDEEAAWHMLQPNNYRGTPKPVFKIAGVSNGHIYALAVESLTGVTDMAERKAILKKGYDDEVAAARGHFEYPRNPNIKDISGKIQDDPRVLGGLPR